MNELLAAFVDAVNSELLRQMCEVGEDVPYSESTLDLSIKRCLELMVKLEQQGESFDHRTYSEAVLKVTQEGTDSDVIIETFREYCHFESMLLIFPEFPRLRLRLRKAGLDSWTKLRVDNQTLQPFAQKTIDRLEVAIMRGGVLPPGTEVETAELINQISNLFDIPLPEELRGTVNFYLGILSSEEVGDDGDETSSRVLN